MAKKAQPVLVIWVAVMIVALIGIGMGGYFTSSATMARVRNQHAVRKQSGAPASASAAFFMRPGPMWQMPNRPAVSPGPQANTYSQLSDEINEITVSIYDGSNGPGQARFLGSGVIVTGQEVLTNAHIVNNKTNLFVYVFAPKSVAYPVTVSRCDAANDLALLKVANNSTFSSIGLLGNPDEVAVGDSVFAMGNAFGNGNVLLSGVIMDKNFKHPVNGQIRTSMRTNISISPGTCGGPLVNTKGEIIGISNSENDYFVTPVDKALFLIYSNPQKQAAPTASAQFV
jgi:S1-C subfamily serine protease